MNVDLSRRIFERDTRNLRFAGSGKTSAAPGARYRPQSV